uniref:Uncharacterized protein n=1 Tax=Pipistrellus kuhlii TaxID=59472 RepID=A0A7J7RVR6_PIPKU|nr:hypothetical protein mPipKuh1_000545 [Pipistrellus kuhlii]
METGPRPPGRPALWAPVVLALGLGLAGTQRTLEEVPVQPGFDAQKPGTPGLPHDPLRLALHSIATRGPDLEFLLFWT